MIKLFSIPNILTLLNLFSGSLAIVFIVNHQPNLVLTCLIASLFFDFLDGMVARALKISGPMGIELDSLADMVSFGLVPGMMVFDLLNGFSISYEHFEFSWQNIMPFLALIIPLFSALRLAKFNIDIEQASYFKGLATPANTLFLFSIYYLLRTENPTISFISSNYLPYILIVISLITSFLLISDLPLFALKFKSLAWEQNHFKYIFLILCLLMIILLRVAAIPLIIVFYILFSLIFRNKFAPKI